jgi:arylformamidase
MAYLWQHASELELNRDRLTVMGHSAGGHITQMLMATDWPSIDRDLPADLIKSGVPISPLSYLEPVRLTDALNAGIRMDEREAEAESPMTNHPPSTNAPQLVVVGGAETDEFHRQSHMYRDKYVNDERSMAVYIVPGVDHFDELNVLADSSSEFFAKTLGMLGI